MSDSAQTINQVSVTKIKREEISSKKQREIFGLLSIGSLLEYLDVSLYIHMAVVIDKVFFPKYISNIWILANFTICSTYMFKPFGSFILGRIGDIMGRRFIIYSTTMTTCIVCLTTVFLPSYEKIGITAAYILTACRVLQGIMSTAELQGAKLYLMENIKDEKKQCMLASALDLTATLGKFLAISIATFAIYLTEFYSEGWRVAFVIGSVIGCFGYYARKSLRESTEFANSKKRIVGESSKSILNHPAIKKYLNKKAVFFYFTMALCHTLTCHFFPFFYCKELLVELGVSAVNIAFQHQIITILAVIKIVFCCFLITFFKPLKINIFINWCSVFAMFLIPFILFYFNSRLGIFVAQIVLYIIGVDAMPASPIFYKQFIIFKRSTTVLFGVSVAQAAASLLWLGPIQLLTKYLGPFAWHIILLPLAIITLAGKYYFKNLQKKYII